MNTNFLKVGVVGIAEGWSSNRLVAAFAERTGYGCLVDMGRVSVDLQTGKAFFEDVDLHTLDGLVVKKIGAPYSADLLDRLAMLRYIQHTGLPVYSNPTHIKRVLDRLSCTISLRELDIPMPPTTITEDVDQAVAVVGQYGRAVLKPLYTSKARGMRVVTAGATAKEQIQTFQQQGNPVLYIQQLVENLGHDLGLAFLAGKFIGCYARIKNKDSWNTTTDSGGKYQAYDPDQELIDMAYRAQAIFDLDFTCVDVAETADGPMAFEVSAFGGFRGLYEACNIDAAALYADYVLAELSHESAAV